MKTLLCVALCIAAAVAFPVDDHHVAETKSYKPHAKPYKYAYGVNDPYHGLDFGQHEDSDGSNVQGSYTVQLPDGRKQIVKYIADHHNGYHAEVSYEGHAQYPPKSEYAPFIVPHKGGGAPHKPIHEPIYGPPH